jgi:Zn-dependent protease
MMGLGLDPVTLIARLIVLATAFTVHEFAHAWTATQFGDNTPRQYGRLTLNPLAHLDPLGSLMLIFAGFGWAKPVPVNAYALQRNSSAALMWVSLAGPLSNLLMALIAAIPLRLGLVSASGGGFVSQLLLEFVWINLLLMLFNLIPLAPLDGDKIVDYFFPPQLQRVWDSIRPYGPMILMLLFLSPMLGVNILGSILGPPMQLMFRLLVG